MWIEFPGFVFIFNGARLCKHLPSLQKGAQLRNAEIAQAGDGK